jgi:hypothetical protein
MRKLQASLSSDKSVVFESLIGVWFVPTSRIAKIMSTLSKFIGKDAEVLATPLTKSPLVQEGFLVDCRQYKGTSSMSRGTSGYGKGDFAV